MQINYKRRNLQNKIAKLGGKDSDINQKFQLSQLKNLQFQLLKPLILLLIILIKSLGHVFTVEKK